MERTVTSLSLDGQRAGYPSARTLPENETPARFQGSAPARTGDTSVGSAVTVTSEWQAGIRWMIPLWRHAVWLIALGALLTLWVDIRVDVQQLRKDLDRSGRAFREAQVHNDRLRLEIDARRRSFAIETAAATLDLSDRALLVDLPVAPAVGGP